MNLIECNHITLQYDGKQVVRDLSFVVEQGTYLCIVGENGSGKSTLLKCLLGLKKQSQGQVVFASGFTREQIGYLPQKTQVQRDFPATVEEIVLSGLLGRTKQRLFYTREQRARVAEQMDKLEISHLAKACFRELSGGQQQRVLLARALTAATEMLVLDEPANGLDPLVTAELYEQIKEQNKQGMTVIMVSHDIETALHAADTVLHLADEEYFFGTKSEYIRSPLFRRFWGGKK